MIYVTLSLFNSNRLVEAANGMLELNLFALDELRNKRLDKQYPLSKKYLNE